MVTLVYTIRHLFTPHESNNHRPHILHPSLLTVIIGFLVLLQLSFRVVHEARPDILGFATNITIDQLLQYTNNEREQTGVGTLTFSPVLSHAAEKKAQDMFADDYWAHNAPDGTTPWDFIVAEGYKYTYAGENLARDFSSSKDVVDAWMQSPSHRDNLLRSEYDEIGFAVVNGVLNGRETTLVVQMFGKQRGSTVANIPSQTVQSAQNNPLKVPVVEASGESVAARPAGIVMNPNIDLKHLQKNSALILLGIFMTVLVMDGYLIWKRKTVRFAGHNLAHFIFLLMIVGVVLLSTSGAIL